MQGLIETLLHSAKNDPDRVIYDFLDCEGERLKHDPVTVAEVYDRASDIAAELRRRGAKAGDRAIIFSMQDKGTVFAIYGCMLAGVIFTVLPPPIDDGKIARFLSALKSCKAKFLISNAGLEAGSDGKAKKELLKNAFWQAAMLRRVYTDRIPARTAEAPVHHFKDEDTVYLQYTSGSTSEPKGVMVSYGNLKACFSLVDELFHFVGMEENNLASWVPFYHNIGLVVAIFIPLLPKKGTSYFIPTMQFLQRPEIWVRVLAECKVNVTAAPNSAYDAISRLMTPPKAAAYDLSHVTHLINGSEFVNARTVERFCSCFGLQPNAFAPGYGLSECVCVATLASQDYRTVTISPEAYREGRFVPVDGPGKEIVSVGRPAYDIRIATIRPDGTLCAPDEIGEICLSGSGVCSGYWQNPVESERFHTHIEGLEGEYYRTGDMGAMYGGCLYLTGRVKEMLILNGKNIFPGDVALLLSEQGLDASLEAVSVFSVAGGNGEQAVLCAECGGRLDFPVLSSQINRAVAGAFGFSFADIAFVRSGTLPRTDNRKIKTLETRRRYEEGKLDILWRSAKDSAAEIEEIFDFEASDNATDEELRAVVRGAFEGLLPAGQFGDDDSFLELGGDSLDLLELACSVERRLGREIDLREIAVNPTVAGIAGYLGRFLRSEDGGHTVDLRSECVLPQEIVPAKGELRRAEDCRRVFLTGATGFLGAYLLRSLLTRHRGEDFRVICHVRAKTKEAGMERVVKNLQSYHIWDEAFRSSIDVVLGDLAEARLGLPENQWEQLAHDCDLVIHNGAVLNFIYPYERMRAANVGGTAETLRFACEGRPKRYHYISSYSVYDNPSHFGKDAPEDDPLDSPDGYFLGYSETKWVAEQLVAVARGRGLPTCVYRPGDITGTLETGQWKLEDLVSRSLVGCIQMGCMPDAEIKLHLTPVDYVADAVAAIAFRSEATGRAYNLLNHTLMSMPDIAAVMRSLGYNVDVLPCDEWYARLAACSQENALRILACLFTARAGAAGLIERYSTLQPLYRTDNADALLKDTGISCPPVDHVLLERYLRHFASCGYIPAPRQGK